MCAMARIITRAKQLAHNKHGESYVLKIQDAMDIAPDYSDMLNSIGITDPKEQVTVISYLSSLIDIVLERWTE